LVPADVVCITVIVVSVRPFAVVMLTMVWSKVMPGFDCAVAVVAISNAGRAWRVNVTEPLLP
jgi:hypothetical protein